MNVPHRRSIASLAREGKGPAGPRGVRLDGFGRCGLLVRVNAEGAGPGAADVRLYEVSYSEGTDPANKVPDPRFEKQLTVWTAYGDGRESVQ